MTAAPNAFTTRKDPGSSAQSGADFAVTDLPSRIWGGSIVLGIASFARMSDMRCTRDMTVSGVIAADGNIVKLDAPLPVRYGDRVCYGLLADGTPIAFIGSDTPMFEQIWADQQTWLPDVIGVAASEDVKSAAAQLASTPAADAGEPMSISGLRLLSTNDSITIDTEHADHRGFLALNVTANVINLTVNVVASPSQSTDVAAEISDRLLTPLRRWA